MMRPGKSARARSTRTLGALALCLASWLPTAASAAADAPFKESEMKNGLELITMVSKKVPLVTIVLTAKAGAMTETPESNGLTHLWEHMFFKGNARLPDQGAFNKKIRELGIVYNGDTSAEKVRYYFTLPSVYLEDGLQFMADAIMTPLLEQGELEKERRVVLDEYDRNASQPGFDLYRLRRRIMYGDVGYLRDPLGERPVIEHATREQLLKIKEQVFVPGNMALLVGGDIDPAQVSKLVEKYFGKWQNPKGWKAVVPPKFPPFPKTTDVVMTSDAAKNANLSIVYTGPKARMSPGDTFAADLLANLLELRSGRFYGKYIDSGLTYNAGLSYFTQSQAGETLVYAMTEPSKVEKVQEMLLAEPAEWLKPDYFTKEQLENVRRNLLVSHKFELNKPSEYIKSLAFWWAITGLDYYRNYLDNLRRIGLPEIHAYVKKYLIKKPYVASILVSPQDAKAAGLKDTSGPLMAKYFPKEAKAKPGDKTN